MKKIAIGVLVSLAAVVASAQQSAAPAAESRKMDHEACMGSADASESQAKHDAALKAIQADLAAAKTGTIEKKVAALEAAVTKLIALHNEMHSAEMAPATMHGAMDCCAGDGETAKGSMSAKKMDCCAHEGSGAAASSAKK